MLSSQQGILLLRLYEQNKMNRVNGCLWRTHNISITECIVDMGLSQSIFLKKI
jgi:hypothetical protein